MKRHVSILVVLFAAVVVVAQNNGPQPPAFIRPGDNLVVENIPQVPAVIAEKANQYGEFRAAGFSGWNPTRREMLITTRFADVPQVHLVKMPGGARTQLTFFPDRTGGA